jgi:hypothetical protein
MSESQLAEDVRAALDEATAGLRAPAAATARSRGRRRRAARGLLAVVPAVGAIAGVAIAVHGGGTAQARHTVAAPSQSGTVHHAQTAAYITRQVERVLGTADNYIIKTSTASGAGQVTTSYLDPVTGTSRSVVSGSGDNVAYWIQTTASGNEDHWQTTYVDYTNRTWWTKTSHSDPLGSDTSDDPVLSIETTPAQLAKALAAGDLRVSVKGDVNGHPAVQLVYAGPLAAKASAVRYWVDAASYQPVRIDLPPFTAASSIAESWQLKTAANVAQTDKPQVPAGFRQVPPSTAFH